MFKSTGEASAWLAGIIDGEGSVQDQKQKGRSHVRSVRIVNTDERLLASVEDALARLGVSFKRYDRSERARLGRKPIFDIVVSGRPNLLLLADLPFQSAKGDKLRHALNSYVRLRCPARDELVALVAAKSDAAIAASFGVTAGAVWAWRQKLGIAR